MLHALFLRRISRCCSSSSEIEESLLQTGFQLRESTNIRIGRRRSWYYFHEKGKEVLVLKMIRTENDTIRYTKKIQVEEGRRYLQPAAKNQPARSRISKEVVNSLKSFIKSLKPIFYYFLFE